jgi:hypothetical protein
MRHPFRIAFYVIVGIVWTVGVGWGSWWMWGYDSTAGAAAHAPLAWPADTQLTRDSVLPTLVLLVHPHCPCSRATIGELAKLMTDCNGKLAATVLFLHPANMPAGWEQTDLWRSAVAIPGVKVLVDNDGKETVRFGAQTSGQTFLFAPDGRLLFSGGITESRGHSGDNAGRSAIEDLVTDPHPAPDKTLTTPVYGCSLFGPSDVCVKGK